MNKQVNLQDSFLNCIRKTETDVTVYLSSGLPIRGRIVGFDNFVLIVEVEGKQQMIYKHAVSTVAPAKPISWSFTQEEKDTQV